MRYALVVLALALATPAGAQTEPLTLARALDLAREHSPALHAAAGQVTAATGAARERAAPVNPSLELRREHWASPLDRDHFATLSLPLDVTLRRNALRAAGREDVAAAGADAAAARLDVEAGVATAYHAAALATALVNAAGVQAEALGGIAAFEATRLREGAAAEAVALRTQLEADRARLELGRTQAEAERAHAELARAVGVAPAELPHAAPLSTAQLTISLPAPEAALATARARRPELEAARRRVTAAERMASAAVRGSLLGVALEIGAKQTGGYTTGVFAVAIGLPVFDQGAGARQRAHGEQQIAEAELRAAEQRVTTEVTAALGAYQRLLAVRPESAVALAAQGAEIAKIAEAAYREGAISLIELLDAERAHADARAEAARWSAELATARIALNRALGAPIEEGL